MGESKKSMESTFVGCVTKGCIIVSQLHPLVIELT